MKPQETIDYFKRMIACAAGEECMINRVEGFSSCKGCPYDFDSEKEGEAFEVVFAALEKQVPKKLHNDMLGDGFCKCGCVNFSRIFNYCPKCGQRIDWEV